MKATMFHVSPHVLYSAAVVGPGEKLEPAEFPNCWRPRMIEFFQYAMGQARPWTPAATQADTNMYQAARLPMMMAGKTPRVPGKYQWGAVQPLGPTIHIVQYETFSARLVLPELAADHPAFKLWCLLEGEVARPVQ